MLFRVGFIVIYIAIGVTDVLDGLIARRFGYESDLGAKLDSIADFMFYSIVAFIFLKLHFSMLQGNQQLVLVALVLLRVLNVFWTKIKYKQVVFVHTVANKVAGVIVYLVPILFLFTEDGGVVWSILIITFLAALEELLITIKCAEPDLNRASIFRK